MTLIFIGLSLMGISQSEWITFTSDHPSAPIINMQSSTNLEVRCTIEVPGMYKKNIDTGYDVFQRISLPQGSTIGSTGFPEIPTIIKQLAIPLCDSIGVVY